MKIMRQVIKSEPVPSLHLGPNAKPWFRLTLSCQHVTYRKYSPTAAECHRCSQSTQPQPTLMKTAIHRRVIHALQQGAIAAANPTDSHVIIRDMRVRRLTIDDMTRAGMLKRLDIGGKARWTL